MTPKAKLKVAVTGGSGELGTLVVSRLCADRTVEEVVSVDLQPPATVSRKLRAVTCDVRDADIGRHFQGCDVVIHLAFIVGGWRPRAEFDAINIGGSENVFRAAIASGVKHVVYTSSVAAYGVTPGHPVPIVETTPRKLVDDFPYSAAKYRVEELLDGLERMNPNVVITRIRPGILIGTHMENALGDMLRIGVLPDGGGTPAPLVWDEDVADAVVLCVKQGARGAFNVCADAPLESAQLAKIAGLRLLKLPSPVLKGVARLSPLLARAGIGRSTDPAWISARAATMIMSSDKARRELGWKPKCNTAAEVVRRYVDTVPRSLDRRIRVFLKVLDLAGSRGQEVPDEVKRVKLDMHLRLTGPNGGDIQMHMADGKLRVGRGVPRPPTTIVTMTAATFLDLLSGRTETTTASMVGKIRVEGEALAGMFLQGLFATWRSRAGNNLITRRLDAWLSSQSRGKEAA
jgi:nucleoside-diphosphate-sugar epimerase/putative sterol carrier protein